MQKAPKDFLFRLLQTPSPTGFEVAGQRVWAKYAKQYADKLETDAYGNAWATLKGKSNRVLMLEAHVDEIGFMIKHVTKEGFVHVDRIGGSDWVTARGRRLVFFGDKGEVRGIHFGEAFDVGEPPLRNAPFGARQHVRADVDANDAVVGFVVGKRDAGADADLENAPGREAIDHAHGGADGAAGDGAEDRIVDRRPARVGRDDRGIVQVRLAVGLRQRRSLPARQRCGGAPSRRHSRARPAR